MSVYVNVSVLFIPGYRVPHPLVFDVHVKVETMDHRTTPIKVFEAALEDLSLEVETLTNKFEVNRRLPTSVVTVVLIALPLSAASAGADWIKITDVHTDQS